MGAEEKIHRTSSYQRLKEKLKRNPSELIDTSDWKKPETPSQVLQHAIKGAASMGYRNKTRHVFF